MDDLDFSKPGAPAEPEAPSAKAVTPPIYDPQLALRMFQGAGGKIEEYAVGKPIFTEGEKPGGLFSRGARVYLLLQGQIALTVKGKPLHLVMPGEPFGEMAIISDAPRIATATALKASRVVTLDEKQFLIGLQREPEFALMLAGILSTQLRRTFERTLAARSGPLPAREGGTGLSATLIMEVRKLLGERSPTPMQEGNALINAGATGICMYLVTAGKVAIEVDGRTVEELGVGEIFGEAALLGATQRAATATALADGGWLPLTRSEFLEIVRANPALGIALLRSLSQRLQHLNLLFAA